MLMQGPLMTVRAKLRTLALQSVAASFSAALGPVLCAKSRCGISGAHLYPRL